MPGLVIGCDPCVVGSLSEEVLSGPPPLGGGTITASLEPASSVIFAGQTVSDMENFAIMTDAANFSSSTGTVRAQDVSVFVIGDVADRFAPVQEGDVVRYRVTVTDDQGSTPAIFDTNDITVQFAVSIMAAGANLISATANPNMANSALVDIDITGLTAPHDIYNGVYTDIQAGTLKDGQPPFLMPGTYTLSHDGAGTLPAVGDTITLSPGLALFPTGTPSQSTILRRDGVQIGALNDLTHVVQAGEENAVFDAVITLNDGANTDVVYAVASITSAAAVHVFTLIGQDNMRDRALWDSGAQMPVGTRQWDSTGTLSDVTYSLDHVDSPDPGTFSLAVQFALDYKAANPTVDIVFVPRAVRDSGFADGAWVVNGPHYTEAVTATNALIAANPAFLFKGILCNGGSADDTSQTDVDAYPALLDGAIAGYRADITAADAATPFVMGGLADTYVGSNSLRLDLTDHQRGLPDRVLYTSFAEATGLTTSDGQHFDAAGVRGYGSRYATALPVAIAHDELPDVGPGNYDATSDVDVLEIFDATDASTIAVSSGADVSSWTGLNGTVATTQIGTPQKAINKVSADRAMMEAPTRFGLATNPDIGVIILADLAAGVGSKDRMWAIGGLGGDILSGAGSTSNMFWRYESGSKTFTAQVTGRQTLRFTHVAGGDYGSSTLHRDGIELAATASKSPTDVPTNTGAFTAILGGYRTGSRQIGGVLDASLILFVGSSDESKLQQVEGWAAWHLQDAGEGSVSDWLDASHPYFSTRP